VARLSIVTTITSKLETWGRRQKAAEENIRQYNRHIGGTGKGQLLVMIAGLVKRMKQKER